MTILTFNIRNGLAKDGINSWENRKNLTAKTIQEAQADIIGLQEVYDFQLEYLLIQLPEYQCYSIGREDGASAGEHCSILWRKDSFHQTLGGTFWLSETPDIPNSSTWGNRITRICSWVEFDEGFRIYNTHWDHESQQSRVNSAELTLQVLPSTPWILLGDFNAEPDSVELQFLAKAPNIDFVTRDNLIGTFHNFQGGTDGDRIDHVFVSKGIKTGPVKVITTEEGNLFPSDHYPIVLEVTL